MRSGPDPEVRPKSSTKWPSARRARRSLSLCSSAAALFSLAPNRSRPPMRATSPDDITALTPASRPSTRGKVANAFRAAGKARSTCTSAPTARSVLKGSSVAPPLSPSRTQHRNQPAAIAGVPGAARSRLPPRTGPWLNRADPQGTALWRPLWWAARKPIRAAWWDCEANASRGAGYESVAEPRAGYQSQAVNVGGEKLVLRGAFYLSLGELRPFYGAPPWFVRSPTLGCWLWGPSWALAVEHQAQVRTLRSMAEPEATVPRPGARRAPGASRRGAPREERVGALLCLRLLPSTAKRTATKRRR